MVEVVRPLSVSAVVAAFWKVCGVPVHATGTVEVVLLDVDVLVLEELVLLDVDELVLVDELVEVLVELVDDVDVLVVCDVLVEVVDEVLVLVVLLVEVDVDDEVDVLEVDVLVLVVVDVVVLVAKSQPMSVIRSRASEGSWSALVYEGSMTSLGVRSVSQWETEDPFTRVVGAYICTWPLACRPPVKYPVAAATTVLPVQWRSASSIADAARCASVMFGHVSPRL
jgi:hypothetical protein